MARLGLKHVIQCKCLLSQHLNRLDPPLFAFPVFSILDDDVLIPKNAQCPNCGLIHKVTDIGKSNILSREESKTIQTIEEIKLSIPNELLEIIENYDIDLPTYEFIKFIFTEKAWGSNVTLTSESVDGVTEGKYLVILGERLFNIESYELEKYITP